MGTRQNLTNFGLSEHRDEALHMSLLSKRHHIVNTIRIGWTAVSTTESLGQPWALGRPPTRATTYGMHPQRRAREALQARTWAARPNTLYQTYRPEINRVTLNKATQGERSRSPSNFPIGQKLTCSTHEERPKARVLRIRDQLARR